MATSTLAKLQLAIQEVERCGEMFLDVRAESVHYDKQRQQTREALTALRKLPSSCKEVSITRPGGIILHLPVQQAMQLLQQDQQRYEAHLTKLRAEEKRLMGLLADKGAGPQSVGPDRLRAMLTLRDTNRR